MNENRDRIAIYSNKEMKILGPERDKAITIAEDHMNFIVMKNNIIL
jgi:hypothetical protein